MSDVIMVIVTMIVCVIFWGIVAKAHDRGIW